MESTVQGARVPTSVPAAPRTATVVIRGQRVTVECPNWCVRLHGETLAGLDDLLHEGEPHAVGVPTLDGISPAMVTRVSWWPFARDVEDRAPYLAVSLADGGDGADLAQRSVVEQLADDLERHAARLRALASKHLAVAGVR